MARVNWVDRVPTKPGRVRLIPVQGDPNLYDMTREDDPQVEGTPINAANLNAMQEGTGLTENVTLYVSNSGSDNTGEGTSSSPYATISKALSVIPKQLNGFSATINIAAGAYNENVGVEGFSGGIVTFSGVANASVTINFLLVDHSVLSVENILLSLVGHYGNISLYVLGGKLYVTNNLTISTTGSQGVYMNRAASLYINGVLTINSATATPIVGIIVVQSSALHVVELAGGNNVNTGISASDGGIITFRTNNMTSKTAYVTTNGGRIYSGAQVNVPNY